MAARRLLAALGALAEARAEFIVVGGVAAVLQGAPVIPSTRASCMHGTR